MFPPFANLLGITQLTPDSSFIGVVSNDELRCMTRFEMVERLMMNLKILNLTQTEDFDCFWNANIQQSLMKNNLYIRQSRFQRTAKKKGRLS